MIHVDVVRTVDPTVWPLEPIEAKAQARVRHNREDSLFQSWIESATGAAEGYLGFGLLTQTWRAGLTGWPEVLPLPMAAQLQGITSVQYYASDGTLTTLASTAWVLDTTATPARLCRAPSQVWPSLQGDRQGARVLVTYVVGRTAADQVPELIKQGIRLLVAAQDVDRDGIVKADADAALSAAQNFWALEGRVWCPPATEAC